MPGSPFAFLDRSVRILAVDDEPLILDILEGHFEVCPVYKIVKAENTSDAVRKLEEEGPFHLCLLDLGLDDVQKDEYFLLRHFAEILPIIIFTSRNEIEKAAEVMRLGAKHVLHKEHLNDFGTFLEKINKVVLENILMLRCGGEKSAAVRKCFGVLQNIQDGNVARWAEQCVVLSTRS